MLHSGAISDEKYIVDNGYTLSGFPLSKENEFFNFSREIYE
jgi:hypothetical protein